MFDMKKAVAALAFLLVVFATPLAQAASLYIDPAFPNLQMGDAVTLSVRIDTNEAEEECINAVDGVISYSENLLPVDVSVGDSIFSVWVEQPKIDKEKRTITFAGGLPNGYCGRVPGDPRLTNTIAKLIFRSPGFTIGGDTGTSTGKVEFLPETAAYLNDGFGTKAELALFGSSIELGNKPGATLKDPWREAVITDTIPPEKFSLQLIRLPDERGKYHVIFNTTDKQTGIDQYQIMEEPVTDRFAFNWGRGDAPWVTTRSPHPLSDQSLNSTIYVKAIDKAGNEYIAKLVPEQNMSSTPLQNIVLYGVLGFFLLVVLVALALIGRIIIKRRREKSNVNESTSLDVEEANI
ncbi:MAG: hypothetical protein AAB618_03600 [Patescibacteria group bacterium]